MVSFDKIKEIVSEKQAAGLGRGRSVSAKSTEQAQQAAPSPELPPEPREAPRSGKQEQIVYLNPFRASDGQRSNEIVAERNKMTVKQVQ